jgi:transcriptional regulator with XRE-family HTH domain
MVNSASSVGSLLREWRQRRRLSQLGRACEADISTRHLSFLETGRALPSRDMVLHLSDRLDIPLRERNVLLVAAGYAPVFPERPLDDPALRAARRAIDLVLKGHEPSPALAVDRHWTLVAANAAVAGLISGADPALLAPPVNVLRLSLHPKGLAPRTVNLAEWRDHIFARLRHQIELTADPVIIELFKELRTFPSSFGPAPAGRALSGAPPARSTVDDYAGVAVPFRFATESGVLSFFSTTTVFGTPVDVTLAELAVEAFFPADSATADALRMTAGRAA